MYNEMRKFFRLYQNPILSPLVDWFAKHDWFNNNGKFKEGDKVKYNWFAKVMLGKKHIQNKGRNLWTFSHYETWSKSKGNCVFKEGDDEGCSVFWLRKLYFWEKWYSLIRQQAKQ